MILVSCIPKTPVQASAVRLVRVFSDVLVAILYFDICHYRQSNLAIENPEFSQPVVAGHFKWKKMVIEWKLGDIKS